jgi:hypothetical protein
VLHPTIALPLTDLPFLSQLGCRPGVGLGYASANTTIINNAFSKYGVLKIDPLNVPFEFADFLGAPSGGGLVGFGWASWLQAVNGFGKKQGVGNVTITPANAAAMDYGVVFMGFRLSMNGQNNPTANASSGESCGVILRACNDAHVERVYVEDPKGDGIYLGSEQGGNSLTPSGARIINCKSSRAYRNGFTVTSGIDGEARGNSAIGFRLHGFDFEPNASISVIRNWKGSIYATCNPDGSWGGDSTGNTGGLCITEGNTGQVSDIEFDVQAYYLNGCGVVVRAIDGFDVRVRSRGCTSHGFSSVIGGSKGSVGIVRGYINVPAAGGNGFCARNAGDEISTAGLKIVQAANSQALLQVSASGGTHVGLRAKCTASNPQSGIELAGCSNVVVVAPDLDGFSHSVLFSMASTMPSTNNLILGGRLANATQPDNVLEAGTADNNLIDGCTVVGVHPTITLLGANSKKRNIVGSGAAVVFEDVKTLSATVGAPPTVPGLALATATVAFTGAKTTDQFEVPPPAALPSGYGPPIAWCPSAGNVQIAYPQWSGSAAAPPGMSGNHIVKLKRLG